MTMEPTYFLFSGRLFHAGALAFLEAGPAVRRGGDDPGPEGPEGEPVGDEDEETEAPSETTPGPAAPLVPDHGSPDANPIDPRVF